MLPLEAEFVLLVLLTWGIELSETGYCSGHLMFGILLYYINQLSYVKQISNILRYDHQLLGPDDLMPEYLGWEA